jgi:phosphate transport system substrate-binding protein
MKKHLLVLALIAMLSLTACAATSTLKGTINVYTRDSSSGTREAFFGFIALTDKLSAKAIEVTGNGDMATKVGADTNGIGYVSLTTDFAANKLVALSYGGVAATKANVLNGTYLLQRPFNYVTRATGDFGSPLKEEIVKAFIDYLANSVEGQEIVTSKGGIVETSKATAWATLAKNYPNLSKASTVTIMTGGSTSVDSTLKAALEGFKSLTGAQFQMNQTGSGDGYKRALGSDKDSANKIDIGFASRAFKTEEVVAKGALSGSYCMDGIAVVVHKGNTILKDANKDLLFKIFSGATSTWESVK